VQTGNKQTTYKGWTRDVKAGDRDETFTALETWSSRQSRLKVRCSDCRSKIIFSRSLAVSV